LLHGSNHMNQTSLVGRPLYHLTKSLVGFAEKRGMWSGPFTSSSPELARLWGAPSTSTGVGVNEETALNYAPVWACVKRVSDDVASYSLILYKRLKEGGKERMIDAHLYELLHDAPNREMSAMSFRRTLQAHVMLWGNGYAEIVRNGSGAVDSLELITPNRVTVKRDTRTQEIFYEVIRDESSRGNPDRLRASDMFHIAGLGFDGLVGYSVISKMRESIGLGLGTERFGGSFFGQGSTFGGVISIKTALTQPAEENFRLKMAAQHQGVDHAHKFLLLGNDATYTRLGIPPNDAQFLETRQYQLNEIAMWFGVPPHKIGILDRSTNNNIAHQDLEYYINTLRPVFKNWEHEIWRKLIPRAERKIQFAEHLQDSRYSADIQTRYAAYAVGRSNGWLSADDIRELENMNPLPDGQGKIYTIPLNVMPANRIDEVIDKQVAPDPKPEPAPEQPAAPTPTDRAEEAAKIAEAIRVALEAVETRIAETTTQITTVTAEATQWKDSAGVFEAEVATLRTALSAAEQEAAQLRVLYVQATERADRLAFEQEALRLEKDEETASMQRAVDEAHAEAEAVKANAIAEVEADLKATAARVAQAELDRKVMAQTAVAADLALTKLQADMQAAEARYTETSKTLETEQGALIAARAQVVELEAAIVDAQKEQARLAAERATFEADATSAASAVVEAQRAAEAATVQLAKVTADAEAASQRLAEETARAQTAEAAQQDHLQALRAERAAHASQMQALITANRDLVADAMARLIWKETERARRNAGSPTKFKAWAEGYYLLLEETYIDALRPAMRTHLATIGSMDDVDPYTRAKIHPQLVAALEQIRAVANGDPEEFPEAVERLLTRWERERPAAIADLVLQEEVTYVRSL
jgi:HK97 family phage portal protein